MNSRRCQASSHLAIAENYYHHLLNKNFDTMAAYLHPDIHIISPLAKVSGKEVVVEAAKGLSAILEKIDIRAKFSSNDQVMLAYDFMFPQPIGRLRAAGLIDFDNQLMTKIELFYDGRPFGDEQKNTIFSNN